MTFSNFLQIIFNSFTNLLNLVSNFFDDLLENNFIKLIIFIALFFVIIDLLGKLISLIINITSRKKKASDNKQLNTTDIE